MSNSFYKGYPNRKDWRKPYLDTRRFDTSCKNHQSCSYCNNRRQFSDKKRRSAADDDLREHFDHELDRDYNYNDDIWDNEEYWIEYWTLCNEDSGIYEYKYNLNEILKERENEEFKIKSNQEDSLWNVHGTT
jgi:hypothetical protein